MSESMDNLNENVMDMIRSKMTLESFGLLMVLVTVVASLVSTVLVIFNCITASKIFAVLTIITLVVAFVSLAVDMLFREE